MKKTRTKVTAVCNTPELRDGAGTLTFDLDDSPYLNCPAGPALEIGSQIADHEDLIWTITRIERCKHARPRKR